MEDSAQLFFRLMGECKPSSGFIRSFKMFDRTLLANRVLLEINKEAIKEQQLTAICTQLNMPDKFLMALLNALPDSNGIGFAFEKNGEKCIFKVYLEYWDKLVRELPEKANKFEPALLHLGFKWDSKNNTDAVMDNYLCYPLLSPKNILNRLSRLYEQLSDKTPHKIVGEIIDFASTKLVNDSFIYLEVNEGESGSERTSFDVNLNKANLKLADIMSSLEKMRQYYSVDNNEFQTIYEPLKTSRLSHLAGGMNREGKSFLTVYVEDS